MNSSQVMLNYVQHMQALLMNVALLALPTAASFAISYGMDNFISKKDVKVRNKTDSYFFYQNDQKSCFNILIESKTPIFVQISYPIALHAILMTSIVFENLFIQAVIHNECENRRHVLIN